MHRLAAGDTPEKPIGWRGSSYEDVLRFPAGARSEAGYQLHLIQRGQQPDDWKPMPIVGLGTIEIRIHIATEYRVIVVTKFAEAVYVLHAFTKKTQKTLKSDIGLAKQRYKRLVAERRRFLR